MHRSPVANDSVTDSVMGSPSWGQVLHSNISGGARVTFCRIARPDPYGRACSSSEAEAVGEDGQHLLDPVPQRVFTEGALEGVLADGPGLVGMGEVEIELAPELVQIAVGDDLLAGLEQGRQPVLPVPGPAPPPRGRPPPPPPAPGPGRPPPPRSPGPPRGPPPPPGGAPPGRGGGDA